MLTALMLDAPILAQARAPDSSLKADPRYAFTDRLCDLVIPATDSPGASEAGAAIFVLLALDHQMSDLNAKMLELVRRELDAAASTDFIKLTRSRQLSVLSTWDTHAYASAPTPGSSEHAWRRIKAAIVAGYYTSEIGATKELIFEPVPGSFQNIPLTPAFRSRSNDGFNDGFGSAL